ncbi:MAG: aldose 1-epimerase family protein [Nocardioides sp.]
MVAPTGEQFEIAGGGYRAVVTEGGAALRLLDHEGRPLVDGFAEEAMPPGGRGQVLVPWPNRIRDGAYSFGDRELQLPLSEPARHNASHGLVRWASWTPEEHTAHSVSLTYRLMAQTGYAWTLDLHLLYDLSADGLTVTHTATNLGDEAAPYAAGMHPYLTVGEPVVGRLDALELLLPAATRCLVDERKLPAGDEPVEGTAYDFRVPRPLRDTVLDHAFTGLARDERGRAVTELRDPADGTGVALWVDATHGWLQVYSADDAAEALQRRSLAVEPMTAPADAFNSGRDLRVLAPAGQDGDECSASWGIWAL